MHIAVGNKLIRMCKLLVFSYFVSALALLQVPSEIMYKGVCGCFITDLLVTINDNSILSNIVSLTGENVLESMIWRQLKTYY